MLRFLAFLPPGLATGLWPVRRAGGTPSSALHVHRFRRTGDDPFSNASLYACRCGVVRPGL